MKRKRFTEEQIITILRWGCNSACDGITISRLEPLTADPVTSDIVIHSPGRMMGT